MGIRRFFKKNRYTYYNIDPDEVFLDSQNLMGFDVDQMEGRIEKPISTQVVGILFIFFVFIFSALLYQVFRLQVVQGEDFYALSENNRLRQNPIFATRGNIYDRKEVPLAWNEPQTDGEDFAKRIYSDKKGVSGLIGFISYPQKDSKGIYYDLNYSGKEGVEAQFEYVIGGINGSRIIETNALGDKVSENIVRQPEPGAPLYLSIDAGVQNQLYKSIQEIAEQVGFQGGGGVIMDVTNGEILALVSYPEYSSQRITDRDVEYIQSLNVDPQKPFLNRVTQGLYTPGSIVKPIVALGALNENVIDQYTNILSTGRLEVPNPYNPSNPTYFSDWKAHGLVDVRRALAMSSNVYFYVVGGGHKDIKGLGITKLEQYFKSFGFGSPVEGQVYSSLAGTVPNPEWKKENFEGDDWRLGDTYFTSIGQYGFQTTPLQVVRATAAIANKGKLYQPTILKNEPSIADSTITNIEGWVWDAVHEGMRQTVTEGTGQGLSIPQVRIAAKTGTAELGTTRSSVNSWVTGFFPYDNPRYAFAIVMEQGSRSNLIGGVAVARRVFDWMVINTPEYLE